MFVTLVLYKIACDLDYSFIGLGKGAKKKAKKDPTFEALTGWYITITALRIVKTRELSGWYGMTVIWRM